MMIIAALLLKISLVVEVSHLMSLYHLYTVAETHQSDPVSPMVTDVTLKFITYVCDC